MCVCSQRIDREEDRLKSMKNQESSGDFNDHHEAQKRKWPYSESNPIYSNDDGNYTDKSVVVGGGDGGGAAAKKCMTTYSAYENFQINPQFVIAECSSNGQEQQIIESSDTNAMTTTMATTIASSAAPATETSATATATISNCNQSTIQMLNSMELGENIEYVNILYEDDLLTSIQAPVATESHYINFEPNWGNADILDLDQRNYYYEVNNANTINLTNLNGHMTQHNEHEASTTITHIQHHHQSHIGSQNETSQQRQCLEVAELTVNNHITNNNNHHHSNLNNGSSSSSSNNHHQHDRNSSSNNNNIHSITEYEVIHNGYPEAENGREKSTSNLRKFYLWSSFCL